MRIKIAKSLLFFGWLWVCLFSVNSFAAQNPSPLPADEAFIVNVSIPDAHSVMVGFNIASGYYLYTKRIHFRLEPAEPLDVRLPQGDLKYDPELGRLEVYSGNVSVPLLLNTNQQKLRLDIDYQGCSEEKFCYPPLHKSLLLNLATQTVTPLNDNLAPTWQLSASSLHTLLTDQNGVRNLLGSTRIEILLLIFAGLGLLLAFTPCVLPMIPILTGIIVGQKQSVSTKKAFLLSATYVLGSAITYAIAGLIAAMMGSSLQAWLQLPWIIAVVSGLFVVLALSLFGCYQLELPRQWQNRLLNISNQQQGGTYVGVFIMGMISTLIVSPCVTAPLVGVLMYIAQTGNKLLGASALFAMGIGMGIPLILIGMSAGKWLPKNGPWMEVVKKFFGVLMLGMAIWLLSRITSLQMMTIFWGILLVGAAILLCIYLPRYISQRKFARLLGVLVGISGLVVIGAASTPKMLGNWMSLKSLTTPAVSSFVVVHDLAAFNKQLAIAQAKHKTVMLDFYADWCESCVSMDRHVFSNPTVQHNMNRYMLLRADLTENSANDQALLKYFNVIAPPTVLFFDKQGREMDAHRIVGEVDAKEFLTRLGNVSTQLIPKKHVGLN